MRKTGVLLVAGSSRSKEGGGTLFTLVRELRRQFGGACVVRCFVEQGRPDLVVAVQRLIRRGCNHIVVHTLFSGGGDGWRMDVPRILREALRGHPNVTFEVGDALRAELGLTDLVEQRFAHLLAGDKSLV